MLIEKSEPALTSNSLPPLIEEWRRELFLIPQTTVISEVLGGRHFTLMARGVWARGFSSPGFNKSLIMSLVANVQWGLLRDLKSYLIDDLGLD